MKCPLAIAKETIVALCFISSLLWTAQSAAEVKVDATEQTSASASASASASDDHSLPSTQIGFYDLLSEQQEIYDIYVQTSPHGFIATIKTQEDPRFQLKAKLEISEQSTANRPEPRFEFTPIYYNNPVPNRIIDSMVDYSIKNRMWLTEYNINSKHVLVSQNGIIFIRPKGLDIDKILQNLNAIAATKN